MISSIIGAIHGVTPYQKLGKDLTIPPVDVFPADIPKDIGVTIFPKPILDIPDVGSIPATERENNVIIENPPYIPKSIIDIFPEHVNEGDTIIRMDGGNEGGSKTKVEVPKNVERQVKKLSPEAKKGYDKAIDALENGNTQGLNEHPLSGDRKGQWAVDMKGTGKGRGKGRIIYEKGKDGIIKIIEILTDHNY
ncbi:methylase of polypeptide subunit release factors [Anaerocolumna cellulosilytica]|nr:methylase of polypeptide subunit release factors [Anaerocolumna cellulosilytica]